MSSQSHMNQGPDDEREQEARKIVDFKASTDSSCLIVTALDNRGDLWTINSFHPEDVHWEKLPPLPES